MKKIIQCVPNFSEGKSPEKVQQIAEEMAKGGAKVIDSSMDPDHNRSVFTLIGSPEQILPSILRGAAIAVQLIDLNRHSGAHPRIGALDVVPVVPVQNTTRDEAVVLSLQIAEALGTRLSIPVYLYEWSAACPERVDLAKIRKGGFEGLRDVPLTGARKPDFGPTSAHPTAGATAVGARGPLIAYNVNLNSADISIAKAIATKIRSLRGTPAELPGVKAIGVALPSKNIVQVSLNITRPDLVSIYLVYSSVQREAMLMGVDVLESEFIGACSLEYLLDSFSKSIKLPDFSPSRVIDTHL